MPPFLPSLQRSLTETTQIKTIWMISDNKPGHVSQLAGLEERLTEKCGATAHWLPCQLRMLYKLIWTNALYPPDIVIGAGHKTHKAVLLCAKKYRAFSVLLMKPSLPVSWFDAVICPSHDRVANRLNVLLTFGPVNKVQPSSFEKNQSVILIGGPSKHIVWNNEKLVSQILRLCHATPDIPWQLFTSRRTPAAFIAALKHRKIINLNLMDASADVAAALQRAHTTWITPDSMSMIFEAATAQSRIALFELEPTLNSRFRPTLERLLKEKYAVTFSHWQLNQSYPSPKPLWEADRAADWLLNYYLRRNGK